MLVSSKWWLNLTELFLFFLLVKLDITVAFKLFLSKVLNIFKLIPLDNNRLNAIKKLISDSSNALFNGSTTTNNAPDEPNLT